jgi:adenylate cyclase
MTRPFQISGKLYDSRRVSNESKRWYQSGFYVYGGGACIHIIYLIGAIITGNLPLKIFNICSILSWLIATMAHGYGFIRLALMVAITEIVTHAIFASWIIGLDAGFWIMVLPLGILAQIGRLSRKSVAFWGIIGLIVPILLVLTMPENTGVLSDSILDWLKSGNVALILLMMGLALSVFESTASKLEHELDLANAESERLIENMLPKSIAVRLKKEGRVIAKAYKNVSVIFCDIVGFTTLADTKSPEEIIKILNEIFLGFDNLTVKLGLEKIKTIGDAYMAAAGVPEIRTDHAEAVANMALGMLEVIQKTNEELNLKLSVRIGIHTGQVVAGVIGKQKYAYDLWGDTVNVASRLESQGVAGKIQISKETADALGNKFIIEERGSIVLKGKGARCTYFLIGINSTQNKGIKNF